VRVLRLQVGRRASAETAKVRRDHLPRGRDLVSRRCASEAVFRERFERARSEGDLPADCDPASLARFVATLIQGMSVQAAGGASREDLQAVAEIALRSWPG
jgi:hypothetical protein